MRGRTYTFQTRRDKTGMDWWMIEPPKKRLAIYLDPEPGVCVAKVIDVNSARPERGF